MLSGGAVCGGCGLPEASLGDAGGSGRLTPVAPPAACPVDTCTEPAAPPGRHTSSTWPLKLSPPPPCLDVWLRDGAAAAFGAGSATTLATTGDAASAACVNGCAAVESAGTADARPRLPVDCSATRVGCCSLAPLRGAFCTRKPFAALTPKAAAGRPDTGPEEAVGAAGRAGRDLLRRTFNGTGMSGAAMWATGISHGKVGGVWPCQPRMWARGNGPCSAKHQQQQAVRDF